MDTKPYLPHTAYSIPRGTSVCAYPESALRPVALHVCPSVLGQTAYDVCVACASLLCVLVSAEEPPSVSPASIHGPVLLSAENFKTEE